MLQKWLSLSLDKLSQIKLCLNQHPAKHTRASAHSEQLMRGDRIFCDSPADHRRISCQTQQQFQVAHELCNN